MTKTQHTPGPWIQKKQGVTGVKNNNFLQNAEIYIAITYPPEFVNENILSVAEANANACLIAAAPELLESLKTVVETQLIGNYGAMQLAHKAIAKAEGK